MVRSMRIIEQKRTIQVRYYVSSLEKDVEKLARGVRTCRSVENGLHRTLDMSFRRDDSWVREACCSAENFAMMRRMALSIMKPATYSTRSLKRRRRTCSYDNLYLEAPLCKSAQTLETVCSQCVICFYTA